MAVRYGNSEPRWATDQLVEWNVLGSMPYGLPWTEDEPYGQLVSERKSFAAVLHSAEARESDLAERERPTRHGFSQWQVKHHDELAGYGDYRDPLQRWESYQLE